MEATYDKEAQRMADLERRIEALEARTRRVLWRSDEAGESREEELAQQYGEYVDKTLAAKILGVTRTTIYTMLADGRIQSACAGSRVDVRSIARYMTRQGGVRRRAVRRRPVS